MNDKYDHKDIENKWQRYWEENKIYKVENKVDGKENFYTLVEFSYPSGNLHVGHWYAFAVPDIFARYKKMQGFNVLYPTGFDAFGLPAENAAIKQGADPKKWTYEQMDKMRTQLRSMGACFDWEREVVSCDPSYYKWTQWIFNKFLENNLVYRAKTKVNWCPKDKTILANEQVNDGKCDRCGTIVEQRDQDQWMLRITNFADALINDLERLDWPEEIKSAQKNWIGRSEGAEIKFELVDSSEQSLINVKVFTTRADTLFGTTYLVIAPENPIIENLKLKIENWNEVQKYIGETKNKTDLERQQTKEKTGVELKGIKAINPANREEVPVWVADYVLGGYGTGAIMAVPAYDERDLEFAQKYNLPIKNIEPDWSLLERFGKKITKYKLRDWGVSRQRYWGCPIPIVYDPEGKPHPIPDKHLPWTLPKDVDHTPDGTAPLARSRELLERTEKIFGKGWKPEVETMDTFVDSSWYFYRYIDPKNEKEFASEKSRQSWMPIDLYMGGAEHTTMHLLYSRFWIKAMQSIGLVEENEVYKIRRNRGLILGPDGNKMSKSKGNVINPDEIVDKLGADTVRMYLAFMGPYGVVANYPWDPNGVVGIRRFLERVWKIQMLVAKRETLNMKGKLAHSDSRLAATVHKTIKKVSEDIENFKFNTAISAMMVFLNELESASTKGFGATKEDFEIFLKLLAPFAPHITEDIWHKLGNKNSIHLEIWPKYDQTKIKEEKNTIVVQINSKIRAKFETDIELNETEAKAIALKTEEVQKWLEGKDIKKVIYVANKLINFVV